ncbi:MAG TPA: ferredoxin [Burkholderiaceae bacterium]
MSADSNQSPRRWRVQIDSSRCQGHNRCYVLAPELFDVDELGQGLVRTDAGSFPGDRDKAQLAAANCPELAITIVEADDPQS